MISLSLIMKSVEKLKDEVATYRKDKEGGMG